MRLPLFSYNIPFPYLWSGVSPKPRIPHKHTSYNTTYTLSVRIIGQNAYPCPPEMKTSITPIVTGVSYRQQDKYKVMASSQSKGGTLHPRNMVVE